MSTLATPTDSTGSAGFAVFDPLTIARANNENWLLLDGLEEFREHLGGELTVTLLAGIGRGVEVHEIDAALMRAYAGQLVLVQNWIRKTNGVQVVTVDYAEALRDPGGVAARLEAFLGAPFDSGCAAASVDGQLRRQGGQAKACPT